MPVYLVDWETSGSIPVEASSPEEAKKLAQRNWKKETEHYTEYEVSFEKPVEVKSLEHAYLIDSSIKEVDGDCSVVGSKKSLKDLLPVDVSREQTLYKQYISLVSSYLLNQNGKGEFSPSTSDNKLLEKIEKHILGDKYNQKAVDDWRKGLHMFEYRQMLNDVCCDWKTSPQLSQAIQHYFDPTPALPFNNDHEDDGA